MEVRSAENLFVAPNKRSRRDEQHQTQRARKTAEAAEISAISAFLCALCVRSSHPHGDGGCGRCGTERRRRGIGRRLVETFARTCGARSVEAEVNQRNAASQALFRSLGFAPKRTLDWFVREVPA
jgi:hypothetical protein